MKEEFKDQGNNIPHDAATYPQYQQPVVMNQLEHKKDSLAACSLVVGIFSILFCWTMLIPHVLAVAGIITGIMSLVKSNQHTGMALTGVILSAAGFVLGTVVLLLFFILL